MKNQKLALYVFKILVLIFLSYLTIKDHYSAMALVLIGFIAAAVIWEGIRDFGTKANQKST